MNQINRRFRSFYENSVNGGRSSNRKDFLIDDPTFLTFNLFFDFQGTTSKHTSFFEASSPLFNERKGISSAINYLKSIDEAERANELIKFKKRFSELSQFYPYYFTSLSGLENMNSFSPELVFRMNEKKLTISTLESMDLRMSDIIERYMNALYDFEYMRQMIPDNLLEFRLYLMISEIRNLKTYNKQLFENPQMDGKIEFDELNSKLNHMMFVFDQCKFDFSESNPYTSDLSSGEPEVASNSFSITVGYLKTQHKLDFIELLTGETSAQDTSTSRKLIPPLNGDELRTKAVARGIPFIRALGNNIDSIANIDLGTVPVAQRSDDT